jgi:hypothetical protein
MLEHINSVEKLLIISIPNLLAVLEGDKIPKPAPFFNTAEYFSEIEKGLFEIAFLHVLVERRLVTPSRNIQDPPRSVHGPRIKVIYKEHRKLRRCLRILGADIDLRQDVLLHASISGWYQAALR